MYLDVLGRHRRLVFVAVALSFLLAFLSVVRVSAEGLTFRTPEVWRNEATVLITQRGFPEGRSVLPPGASSNSGPVAPPFADTGRFTALVDLYAAFATSDAVVAELVRRGLIEQASLDRGELPISAEAIPSKAAVAPTPLLKIAGQSTTPADATQLTVAATNVLRRIVARQQEDAKIPVGQRTVLDVVRASGEPTLAQPRSMTLPVVIILAGLSAAVAAAFIRENAARRKQSGHANVAEMPSHVSRSESEHPAGKPEADADVVTASNASYRWKDGTRRGDGSLARRRAGRDLR